MSEQLGSGWSHTRVQVKQTAEHNAKSNSGACGPAMSHPSSADPLLDQPPHPRQLTASGTVQPPKKRHHFLSICAAGRVLYKHTLPSLTNTLSITHSLVFCFLFSQTPFSFSHLRRNETPFSENVRVRACAVNGIH